VGKAYRVQVLKSVYGLFVDGKTTFNTGLVFVIIDVLDIRFLTFGHDIPTKKLRGNYFL
jgi:hypothetical protein